MIGFPSAEVFRFSDDSFVLLLSRLNRHCSDRAGTVQLFRVSKQSFCLFMEERLWPEYCL